MYVCVKTFQGRKKAKRGTFLFEKGLGREDSPSFLDKDLKKRMKITKKPRAAAPPTTMATVFCVGSPATKRTADHQKGSQCIPLIMKSLMNHRWDYIAYLPGRYVFVAILGRGFRAQGYQSATLTTKNFHINYIIAPYQLFHHKYDHPVHLFPLTHFQSNKKQAHPIQCFSASTICQNCAMGKKWKEYSITNKSAVFTIWCKKVSFTMCTHVVIEKMICSVNESSPFPLL